MKPAIEREIKERQLKKLLHDNCMHLVDDPILRLSDRQLTRQKLQKKKLKLYIVANQAQS